MAGPSRNLRYLFHPSLRSKWQEKIASCIYITTPLDYIRSIIYFQYQSEFDFFFCFFFIRRSRKMWLKIIVLMLKRCVNRSLFLFFSLFFFLFFELNERFYFISSLHIFCFCPACADKSGDFSPFHSIVYVHPPPTYSLRASASFTDRL